MTSQPPRRHQTLTEEFWEGVQPPLGKLGEKKNKKQGNKETEPATKTYFPWPTDLAPMTKMSNLNKPQAF